MAGNMMEKVPVREQDPKVRAANFEEVCLGYNEEEAVEESQRCLHCKNAKCIGGCPVNINIPEFIEAVKTRDFARAYNVISESSSLPAVCGRVCPQETQCEGRCIRGIKGEPVSIGKLEQVRQALPARVILRSSAMMSRFSKPCIRRAAFLFTVSRNSVFPRTRLSRRKWKMSGLSA